MSEQGKGKKRSKAYYKKCAAGGKKNKSCNDLDARMKGFLVTCNKYEKETVREMYNLLNEYGDQLYGPENTGEKESDSEESDEDDMEKAIAKEKSAIVKTANSARRFQNTNTKFKNLIFIRTTEENPSELAYKMFSDMFETRTQKARYAQRMIPISCTCKAQMKNIEASLKEVLKPHFETPFGVGLRFTSVCKIRNNNSVQRCAILPLIGRQVQEMNPLHKLCHDDPELVIVVEVIRNICCLGVVKEYFKFRKYNFQQVVKSAEDNSGDEDENVQTEKETSETVAGDNAEEKIDSSGGKVDDKINNPVESKVSVEMKCDESGDSTLGNKGIENKTDRNEKIEKELATEEEHTTEGKDNANLLKGKNAVAGENVVNTNNMGSLEATLVKDKTECNVNTANDQVLKPSEQSDEINDSCMENTVTDKSQDT